MHQRKKKNTFTETVEVVMVEETRANLQLSGERDRSLESNGPTIRWKHGFRFHKKCNSQCKEVGCCLLLVFSTEIFCETPRICK
jgi:hypothetical protein